MVPQMPGDVNTPVQPAIPQTPSMSVQPVSIEPVVPTPVTETPVAVDPMAPQAPQMPGGNITGTGSGDQGGQTPPSVVGV